MDRLNDAAWLRSGSLRLAAGILMCLTLGLGMTACRDVGPDLMPTYLTEGTELDVTIRGDVYEITIVDYAGTDTVLGDEGEDAGLAQVTQYTTSAVQSKRGKWIILPVRIKNISGEEQLLFSRVLKVVDAQGNEYQLTDRLAHNSYVFFTEPERYGTDDNLIVQNVFDIDEERLGPAIFDVPEDAEGLTLVLEGSEQTLATGY